MSENYTTNTLSAFAFVVQLSFIWGNLCVMFVHFGQIWAQFWRNRISFFVFLFLFVVFALIK